MAHYVIPSPDQALTLHTRCSTFLRLFLKVISTESMMLVNPEFIGVDARVMQV